MNKVQAISRISEASDTDEVAVAVFPPNICPLCHRAKDTLFWEIFAGALVECCGPCAVKLRRLEQLV